MRLSDDMIKALNEQIVMESEAAKTGKKYE